MPVRFLIPRDKYLAAGVHIGTQQKTKQMDRFVYKIRPMGLAVLNLRTVDDRIRTVGRFLSSLSKIIVVSRKSIACPAITKFAEIVGAKAVCGRFMPGMLTNPNYKDFYEADVVFVIDPLTDYQAVDEAVKASVPLVSICDTFNETRNIDLILPANNKGRRSMATLFWLLAREVQKNRGAIKSDREFKYSVEDFIGEVKGQEEYEEEYYDDEE
jgi:small subunit ribosomal protein S2